MIDGFAKSVLAVTLVELESCKTNPSIGSLPLTNSLGTKYLSLYTFSSIPLSSSLLKRYVISLSSAPEYMFEPS